MIKKKPFDFMRKKEVGYIKVWKTRGEYPTIRQAWTDGSIMVFENQEEFPEVPGNYKFDGKRKMITPAGKNFPKFHTLIPKCKGYKNAKALEKNGNLCLERIGYNNHYKMIVELQAEEIKTLVNLDYFDYLEDNYGTTGEGGEWRIKGKNDPILFLWEGEFKAVVMPIRGGENGKDKN